MSFKFGDKIDSLRANNLNPIVLAFIGDAVYSLLIREKLSLTCDCKTGELNKLAVEKVKASAQASFIKKIMLRLTEEEVAIYKRARNAKKTTRAKSASVSEYNNATGFEALIGYLYLIGDINRINELFVEVEDDEG